MEEKENVVQQEQQPIEMDLSQMAANIVAKGYSDILNGNGKIEDNIKLMQAGTNQIIQIRQFENDEKAARRKEKKEKTETVVSIIGAAAGFGTMISSFVVPVVLFKKKEASLNRQIMQNQIFQSRGEIIGRDAVGSNLQRKFWDLIK